MFCLCVERSYARVPRATQIFKRFVVSVFRGVGDGEPNRRGAFDARVGVDGLKVDTAQTEPLERRGHGFVSVSSVGLFEGVATVRVVRRGPTRRARFAVRREEHIVARAGAMPLLLVRDGVGVPPTVVTGVERDAKVIPRKTTSVGVGVVRLGGRARINRRLERSRRRVRHRRQHGGAVAVARRGELLAHFFRLGLRPLVREPGVRRGEVGVRARLRETRVARDGARADANRRRES